MIDGEVTYFAKQAGDRPLFGRVPYCAQVLVDFFEGDPDLPVVVGPLIVLMNDREYLKSHVNGWVSNAAVLSIVALAFVLALVAIPLQFAGS